MKVGILGLLRHDIKVTYYTCSEIWEWLYCWSRDQKQLGVRFSPSYPQKAKIDKSISDDVREARRKAFKDTTVIVEGVPKDEVRFSDYLPLIKPPAEDLFNTDLGSILTGDQYRSKIFVKGIFIEKRALSNPPSLYYGVDFIKAPLDRDRRSLMTDSAVANTLAQIWNEVISRDEKSAPTKYLKLLLAEERHLEVLNAFDCISRLSATILLRELRSLRMERFFYSAEDSDIPEVLPIRLLVIDC